MLIEIRTFSGADDTWKGPLVGCFGSDYAQWYAAAVWASGYSSSGRRRSR